MTGRKNEKEIPKIYQAKDSESRIYREWEEGGFFHPETCIEKGFLSRDAPSFTIMMPPPNVTGVLHLGHALENFLMDVMARFQRMRGKRTLLVPGTDHAAIATQARVEKDLIEHGIKNPREELGREELLRRIREYAENSKEIILMQMRKMGTSCDWSRLAYTFDEARSKAVNEIFLRMYNDGLIYRGKRIVNWCVQCQSALSDDEVEYKEEKAPFYYIKYGDVIIATARPETKFADKIIIFHPDDRRYKGMNGKKVTVPWLNGEIEATYIADPAADPEFGSGAMTITPAHDFVDFELAQKHGFEIIEIIKPDGTMTEVAGEFAGMPVRECREKLVKKMEKLGLIDHIDENYVHNLSICYRCGNPVEPLISKQWFVAVNKEIPGRGKTFKDLMRDAVLIGHKGNPREKVHITPDRFIKTYLHWIDNLHDWCISRQIWWGHPIPIEGDPDTLDTWFSSGTWTFSTLRWPEKTNDLKIYHPTSWMQMGYEIIFFWMARMILMSTYVLDEIPFKNVYFHGLVRDKNGQKFSKSLRNTINPLDMIQKYGADALRLSFLMGVSPGNDIRFYEEKVGHYQHFVNKFWNISRYILMSRDRSRPVPTEAVWPTSKTAWDMWILSRLAEVIQETTDGIEQYEFARVGEVLYNFTWHDFADWYIEVAKIEGEKNETLLYILQTLLRLWHPYMPFVTERIWEYFGTEHKLIVEPWPGSEIRAQKSELRNNMKEVELVMEVITKIREARASFHVPPSQLVSLCVRETKYLSSHQEVIRRLARVGEVKAISEKPAQSITLVFGEEEMFLPVGDFLDIEKEKARVRKEVENLENYILSLAGQLGNEAFLRNAKPEIIEETRKKKEDTDIRLVLLKNQLEQLS